MYLLDTNHCSCIIQGHPVLLGHLQELGDTPIATCVIVRGELVFMAEKSQQKAANLPLVQAFLQNIRVYPVDDAAAATYGELKGVLLKHFGPREQNKRRKTRIEQLGISENDLWIAAIAIRHGLTLVSADSDFTRMQQAKYFPVENWWSPEADTSSL
jgi:tRNA(fMet)-specific endonuclease VapC